MSGLISYLIYVNVCLEFTDDEKLATPRILEQITLLSELPPKTPAPDGIINCGVVVSITNPGDFYIIPHGDWTCACKHGEDSQEYTGRNGRYLHDKLNFNLNVKNLIGCLDFLISSDEFRSPEPTSSMGGFGQLPS